MKILQVLRSGNPEVILELFFWLPTSNSLEFSLPANDIRNLTAAQYTHHWHVQLSCHHFSPVFIEKPLNDSLLVSFLTHYCPFFNIVAEGDPVKIKVRSCHPSTQNCPTASLFFQRKVQTFQHDMQDPTRYGSDASSMSFSSTLSVTGSLTSYVPRTHRTRSSHRDLHLQFPLECYSLTHVFSWFAHSFKSLSEVPSQTAHIKSTHIQIHLYSHFSRSLVTTIL